MPAEPTFPLLDNPAGLASLLATRERRVITRAGLRCSAVLAAVVRIAGEWRFLLTQRTETVEHHKGQVSFPGGACEDGESREATALRESREEIALDSARVTVLGRLGDLQTPSGYVITPVVGVVSSIEGLVPSPAEVARILTIPVGFFADDRNRRVEERMHDNRMHEVTFYDHALATVWGATAVIIREFLEVLGNSGA